MADYRMDCCGGFPSHNPGCKAEATYEERKKTQEARKALLDKMWARYGELVASATRSKVQHDKDLFGHWADGFLEAIHMVEAEKQ